MRFRKILYRPRAKQGAPPGSLIHVGEKKTEETRILLMDYDRDRVEERKLSSLSDCLAYRDSTSVTWLNIDGIHDTRVIETAGECFDLHPLVLEDILNTQHRPKFEDYENYLFIILKMLRLQNGTIYTEQVSLILGDGFVLSFQEDVGDVWDGVRERIRSSKGRIRKMGADYLAYALLDSVVDSYYGILEEIGDHIEDLEDELIDCPTPKTLQKIHSFKREMIVLRKSIWPLREVIASFQREEAPLVQETTGLFLRDVYDHTIQVVDTVETYRDIIAGMLDLYLSSISNRMNEVMKVLTIIATIFIPLTFIAGVYGMNFEYMPELGWKWGYPAVWGVMIATALGLVAYFRRKHWF